MALANGNLFSMIISLLLHLLANSNNIDLKDKWRNLGRSVDRRDYVHHPPPSSSKRRRKTAVEELSDPNDYHNPCTYSCQRKQISNNIVNQTSKTRLVEDLYDSEDYHNPCTITPQYRGTRNMRGNVGSKGGVVEELSDSQDYLNPCTITPQRIRNCKKKICQDFISRKLNSEKVQNYLENLWLNFSEDKRSAFTYLDPLWYVLFSNDSNKGKVLSWIKKKGVFSKKYVVFPILEGGHWVVLIFCHLGGSLGSTIETPCILLLDSMANTEHSNKLEPIIKRSVLSIYTNSERIEDPRLLCKMPFLVPKVPQQRDKEECGVFALYYIKLFVDNAPESFSKSDGYPYFMKKDWFNFEELKSFRETLDSTRI